MNRYHLDNYFDQPLVFGAYQVIQAGRLYCKPGGRIDPHSHRNWFELTVVTSGTGEIFTNQASVPVRRGDIHLSFPADLHGIVSAENNPLEYDFFSFYLSDPELLRELNGIALTHMPAESRVIREERVGYLVQNAIQEITSAGPHSGRLLQSICEQTVIYLIRAFGAHEAQKPSGHASHPDMLCYQMMNYIDTHVFSLQSLEELSDALRYNYSYLSALFKRTTGQTLADYYRLRRLKMARRLMDEGKLSLTQIAEMLNYSTVQNLSRAYKREYGAAPSLQQAGEAANAERKGKG